MTFFLKICKGKNFNTIKLSGKVRSAHKGKKHHDFRELCFEFLLEFQKMSESTKQSYSSMKDKISKEVLALRFDA